MRYRFLHHSFNSTVRGLDYAPRESLADMRSHSLRVCLSWALLLWGATAAAGASSQSPRAVLPQAASSNAKIFKREQNGIEYNVFEHAATNSTVSFVQDSGICETTPGVTTYSGYLSVGTNMSMFFWFFEARNNASSAPLALWLNGGPGCSSMIGLFQENGPCNFPVNGSTDEPTLNPYSWNNYAVSCYEATHCFGPFAENNSISKMI